LSGPHRDTFLFTRGKDRWELAVANGKYRVTVCVGDAGHDQPGQGVLVEGVVVVDDQTTYAGRFLERSTEIDLRDERLTVQIGSGLPGCNTCLNWLQLEAVP
jgi:hypothetical protein